MKCTNCGNDVQPADTVCQACGTEIPEPQPQMPRVYREDTDERYVWYIQKKFVCFIGIAVASFLAMCVAFAGIISVANRVDVTQYLRITVEGYNGYGDLHYSLDDNALLCDLYNLNDESEMQGLSDEERAQGRNIISSLKNSITVDAELSRLSNDDTITFTYENLKDIEKANDVKFRNNAQLTYTVENLQEAKNLGVDSLFDVRFAGYDGSGCVAVTLKESDNLPFDFYSYGGQIQIDGYGLEITTSENEGTLTNGDTFTICIRTSSNLRDYLVSSYGIGIAEEEKMDYTVDGLMERQEIDLFSMLEYGVSGLDGAAKTTIHWNETEKDFGDFRVAVENADYGNFAVYTKVYVPAEALTIGDANHAEEEEYFVGSFKVMADKEHEIASGNEITFRLMTTMGEALAADSLAADGIVFSSVEEKLTVETNMLERYVTSADQVNAQNVKALAAGLEADVAAYLKDNWSRIIHGNAGFICYDQVIKEGPAAVEAYIACTDANSNSYKLWILFTGSVTDSETTEAVPYYILAEVNKPTILPGAENAIHTLNSVGYSYYESVEALKAAGWFMGYQDVMTPITLK